MNTEATIPTQRARVTCVALSGAATTFAVSSVPTPV